jgi:glycosyltransferase involved in cell wall biosynthesis
MGARKILIVIPTYNNRLTLRDVAARSIASGYDVLVVDDGSTDGAPETIRDLGVHLVSFPVNRGKGEAIKAGAAWAGRNGFSHIITLDADGQHNPEEIPLFAERIAKNPLAVVLGTRDFESIDAPPVSSFGRKFSNFWVRFTSGLVASDSQSGFRAYPVFVLDSVKCFGSRYNFEVEILVRCCNSGVPVESVPIKVVYSEETKRGSHFRPFVDNTRISLTFTSLVIRNLFSVPYGCYTMSRERGTIRRISFFGLMKKLRIREVFVSAFIGGLWGTLPLIIFHKFLLSFFATRIRAAQPAFSAVTGNLILICGLPFVPFAALVAGHFALKGALLFPMLRPFWEYIPEYFAGAVLLSPIVGLAFLLGAGFFTALAGLKGKKHNGA